MRSFRNSKNESKLKKTLLFIMPWKDDCLQQTKKLIMGFRTCKSKMYDTAAQRGGSEELEF